MRMAPVLVEAAPLFEYWKVTVPGPVPWCPPLIAIHATSLTAVQVQPGGAWTENEPEPAAGPADNSLGEREIEQLELLIRARNPLAPPTS